jgi:hypothetical protein
MLRGAAEDIKWKMGRSGGSEWLIQAANASAERSNTGRQEAFCVKPRIVVRPPYAKACIKLDLQPAKFPSRTRWRNAV